MTMFKRGTQDSSIVISSSVYSCSSCDYTEIATDGKDKHVKKCPECGEDMAIISTSAEGTDSDDSIE